MKILPVLLALLLAAGPAAAAGPDEAAEAASRRVAAAPADLAGLFDAGFFKHISLGALTGVFSGLHREHGAVERVVLVSSSPSSGHYYFDTAGGWRVPAALAVNADGRIVSLFFRPAWRRDATLRASRAGLEALPGRKGFLVRRLGEGGEDLEALAKEEHFAVGSAFKLYVLGALVKAGVPWDRVYRLRPEDRSLPTGRLQGWPAGSPLTAHTLAALMLSESDNTASDALIGALGRRRIEETLPALGDPDPAGLKPFLRTSEMFRLKADTAAALEYMNLPAARKYAYLDGLGGPLPAVDKVPRSPFGVDKIEWFASPADLCRLADWLRREGGERALELLALNTGLPLPEGDFSYAGYKGGSEAGVLSMTWLLRTAGARWYCVSASWNDERDALEEKKFFALLQSALAALAAADRAAPGGASAVRPAPASPAGP